MLKWLLGIFTIKKKTSEVSVKNSPPLSNIAIDISHHNKKVILSALTKYAFVSLKATEGRTYIDSTFEHRWLGLGLLGIKRSAYHFYRANVPWYFQAEHFIKTVGELKLSDMPLALDIEICEVRGIEQTKEEIKAAMSRGEIAAFLEYIYKATGRLPYIYINPNLANYLKLSPYYAKYPLWLADYTPPANIPAPWTTWDVWQYSEKGNVEGIDGNVDMNMVRT